ncbi:MAG: hypothetical protein PHY31_08740 [Smithellaceae bacterium]|nr:hypothetical protein [Smithellaceae bacterium]
MSHREGYAWFIAAVIIISCSVARGQDLPGTEGSGRDGLALQEVEWGGYLRAQGSVSWPESGTLWGLQGTSPLYDGDLSTRIKNKLTFSQGIDLETHYEAVLSGGDSRRRLNNLIAAVPGFPQGVVTGGVPEDDRRLFDLTSVIDDDRSHILYHRLDRLALTVKRSTGVLRVGRQAVSWGNGLLFNPMDLFNPFSPTDILRDYKVGDDMVFAQLPLQKNSDVQLLYVPRRNPATERVSFPQSSVAGKYHFGRDTGEYDIMAAKHYDDDILGFGAVGYVKGAAWRLDGVWTAPAGSTHDGYLSLVANIDYSWTLWDKNFYGFVEYYFDGLSHDRYRNIFTDANLQERLVRGQLPVLGRNYLAADLQVELHPLLNAFVTVIDNLADPSGIIQPRVVWDAAQSVQVICGGNIYYGGRDTEFGGFIIPGTPIYSKNPDSVFIWVSYYF